MVLVMLLCSVFFCFRGLMCALVNLLFILIISVMVLKFNFSFFLFCSNFVFLSFSVGVIKGLLMVLSIWVSIMMILVSLKLTFFKQGSFLFGVLVLSLNIVVIFFFLADNFLFMYFFFECSLIPTLFLIIKWGYQPERLQASFYFIMYTVCASLPLLLMILKVKSVLFSFSMSSSSPLFTIGDGFDFWLVYLCLTVAFLVKTPMWGVHLWLPKAHVEAPVSGSMVLAGILLKLGGYGMLCVTDNFYKLICPAVDLIFSINLWGSVFISFVCLVCTDMKILIAYSSVVHMNLMVVGILTSSSVAVFGSILMMISHGISSPGMFALANLNYENTQSRNILLQKGLSVTQPSLNLFWFLLIAANMAAPPSLNLVSEIFICVGVLKSAFLFSFLFGFMGFVSAAYNLYLFSSQQSNVCLLVISNKNLNSCNFLMSLSHGFLVYYLLLGVFLLI